MTNEFIASFEQTEQTSEDTWKVQRYNLKVTETTTLAEILEWRTGIAKNKVFADKDCDILIQSLFDIAALNTPTKNK